MNKNNTSQPAFPTFTIGRPVGFEMSRLQTMNMLPEFFVQKSYCPTALSKTARMIFGRKPKKTNRISTN